MLGHVFWSQEFSKKFLSILENEYNNPETADKLWESIYIEHIAELQMKIRKYPSDSFWIRYFGWNFEFLTSRTQQTPGQKY